MKDCKVGDIYNGLIERTNYFHHPREIHSHKSDYVSKPNSLEKNFAKTPKQIGTKCFFFFLKSGLSHSIDIRTVYV